MGITLSEADRARVRHHLGYLNVEPAASIQLGFPSASQWLFTVEISMDRIIPEAVGMIHKYLNILDSIELQMVDELACLKVQQIEQLKLRNSNEEPNIEDLLEQEYLRWVKRLADDLGVEPNPYSTRFRNLGGMNIPVAQV